MAPGPFLLWSVIVFVLGMLIGSFLNVAIYRLPLGMSVNNPRRSLCFRCGTPIKAYHNIPVLSYLLLGGRDRACGAGYSPRYAFVEFLTGCVFLGIWLLHNRPEAGGFHPMSFWYMGFAALLIVGTFTDLDHWIIPASIPRLGTGLALASALVIGIFDRESLIVLGGPFPAIRAADGDVLDYVVAVLMGPGSLPGPLPVVQWWEPFANAVIGAIVAPLVIYSVGLLGKVAFRKEAMGFGDVELFVMIGATVGAVNSVLVLVLASFFGSAMGLVMLVRNRMRKDDSPLRLGELDAGDPLMAVAAKPAEAPAAGEEEEDEDLLAARGMAESLEMDFVDLSRERPMDPLPADFPREAGRRHLALPLAIDPTGARIAVADPMKASLVSDLRAGLGDREIEFVIASQKQLAAWCRVVYEDAAPEAETGETAAAADSAGPLWKRYYETASRLPVPRPTGHLPFIPAIALAALVFVMFYDPLGALMNWALGLDQL